jgi:hypothetical protein
MSTHACVFGAAWVVNAGLVIVEAGDWFWVVLMFLISSLVLLLRVGNISRAFRKADVGVTTSNKNSLGTQLVHLKDPIPHIYKSSVIYHIPCAGSANKPCAATYIGETERSMDTRFRENHNKAKSTIKPPTGEYASAVRQHARITGHHFRPEDVTYLDREGNKMARGINEAIYTRALDPDLNRGGGLRYILPPTFRSQRATNRAP